MADAGTSLDHGHERHESQHGQLSETGVGLERVDVLSTFSRLNIIASTYLSSRQRPVWRPIYPFRPMGGFLIFPFNIPLHMSRPLL